MNGAAFSTAHFSGVTDARFEQCVQLRLAVFVEEQQVPKSLELDGHDPECTHFITLSPEHAPIATLRLRALDERTLKLERMAVDSAYRGQHYGKKLVTEAERFAKQNGIREIHLSAQVPALRFYAQLGYVPEGSEYEEAGIPHQRMRRRL